MNTFLSDEMDGLQLYSQEEIVRTSKGKKGRNNKKNPNPKFYLHLIECLDKHYFEWMLRYVPGSQSEFEVTFTDRKNKKVWKEQDIALFVKLDKYIANEHQRKRSNIKYEEAVKIRFKSNMCKYVKAKYIEKTDEKKIGKCKTVKRYRILWRPPLSVGESRGNGGNFRKNKRKDNKNDYEKISLQKDCKNEILSVNGTHEITHFASVVQENSSKMHSDNVSSQENNCDFLYFFEDDDRNVPQYNYLAGNSQLEIDENGAQDFEINLENLKNSYLSLDLDNVYYPNVIESSMYFNDSNASNQKVQIINAEMNNDIGNPDAYTNSLNQENQLLENVLKSDPLLCSQPKECQKISNSVGDPDDWSGIDGTLKPTESEKSMETSFGKLDFLKYSSFDASL